jgi:hypothetical protein
VPVKVLIAEAPAPLGFTKFHRDANCSGLRKGELADGATYVARELDALPDTVKPCQFPCCFQGYESARDLKARVLERPSAQPVSGIRAGDEVEFRELGEDESRRRRLVKGAADQARGELSVDSPIGRGLLGHEEGQIVDIALPRKTIRMEILSVAGGGRQGVAHASGTESEVLTFSRGEDAKYEMLIRRKAGFVLIQRGARDFMIHVADCWHLELTPGEVSIPDRPRRWSSEQRCLIDWAVAETGHPPRRCGTCM